MLAAMLAVGCGMPCRLILLAGQIWRGGEANTNTNMSNMQYPQAVVFADVGFGPVPVWRVEWVVGGAVWRLSF